MDHMSETRWQKWVKTIDAHISGVGYKPDFSEGEKNAARRREESKELLDLIAGCEDMQDMEEKLNADIAYCENALRFYESAKAPNV